MATCQVVLLEECLLQRAIRMPTDPRVTTTCALNARACSGQLPGDLAAQAATARNETDQVAIEQSEREFAVGLAADAEASGFGDFWEQQFCTWDGGVPDDLDGGADGWAVDVYWCAPEGGTDRVADATIVDASGLE
jgi:hypothetical protein